MAFDTEVDLRNLRALQQEAEQQQAQTPIDTNKLAQEAGAEDVFQQQLDAGGAIPPSVAFQRATDAAHQEEIRKVYDQLSRGEERIVEKGVLSGTEIPGLFERARTASTPEKLTAGAEGQQEDFNNALYQLSGQVPLDNLTNKYHDLRVFEDAVKNGQYLGTAKDAAMIRRTYIARELEAQGYDIPNDFVVGKNTQPGFKASVAKANNALAEVGREIASPLTGYRGSTVRNEQQTYIDAATELWNKHQNDPASITPQDQENFQRYLENIDALDPYDEHTLLGGSNKAQLIGRGIAEQSLRPDSLAALLYTGGIGSGTSLGARIVIQGGVQGSVALGQGLIEGQSAKELAINVGASAVLGGAFGALMPGENGGRINAGSRLNAADKFIDDLENKAILANNDAKVALNNYKLETGQVEVGEGAVLPKEVAAAQERAAIANKAVRAARAERQALLQGVQDAKLHQDVLDTLQSAKVADASVLDQEVLRIVQQQSKDTLDLANATDDLYLNDARFFGDLRRGFNRITAWMAGRAPAQIGIVQDMREGLYVGLSKTIARVVAPLKDEYDGILSAGLKDGTISFKGPEKYAAVWQSNPVEVIQTFAEKNPTWFTGLDRWQGINKQFLDLSDKLTEGLKGLGYPIDGIDDYLAPLIFDVPPGQGIRGAAKQGISRFAKARDEIDNYVDALEKGVPVKSLTAGERWAVRFDATARMYSDIFERNLIIDRYAKKGVASVFSRKLASFQSPLFKGYSAPREVVDAVDAVHSITPQQLSMFRSVMDKTKATAFGAFDIAVTGVHLPFALAHGGFSLVASEIDRAMKFAGLPGMVNLSDPEALLAARYGVRQGASAYNLDFEEGTLLSLVPGVGKNVDKAASNWVKFLGHVQFDKVMTPLRNEMFRGNLVVLHMLGKDITDPAVLRAAAQSANRFTLSGAGAQNAIRRDLEQSLLTSANSVRAEFGVTFGHFIDLANLFNGKGLAGPERILAASSLAWLGASMYGLQVAVYHSTGGVKPTFNPFDKTFGSIRIKGQDISFVKEKSLIKAIRDSFNELMAQDPAAVAATWDKYTVGKGSPGASGIYGVVTGRGYDSSGFFETDLSARQRVLNLLPVAPVLEKLTYDKSARTDPFSMGLEFAGFNHHDQSRSEQLDAFVFAHNPYKQGDPRFDEVVKFGYSGLERAEREQLKQQHPEMFANSAAYSPEEQARQKKADELQNRLVALEDEVKADPYKRRDYADARRDLVRDIAKLWNDSGIKFKDQSTQSKAVTLYYKTINDAEKATTSGHLTGDEWGVAEASARKAIQDKLGDEGTSALDRYLSVGSTPLETEYRTARQTIEKSGYYDIADVVVKQHGFAGAKDFNDAIAEYAREKGIEPKEVPAEKEVTSQIDKAKLAWREKHPEIDALLSIWDGAAPRTPQAAQIASAALGRKIDQSESTKKKKPTLDIKSLLNQLGS